MLRRVDSEFRHQMGRSRQGCHPADDPSGKKERGQALYQRYYPKPTRALAEPPVYPVADARDEISRPEDDQAQDGAKIGKEAATGRTHDQESAEQNTGAQRKDGKESTNSKCEISHAFDNLQNVRGESIIWL